MEFILSKMQDAFFTTVIALMVSGTAAINQAQAAGINKKSQSATFRSYKVKGVRYHPLLNADNFSQTGKASWYGPGFHGKKTSNGERYNMNALTAAHKTLPLGTLVRVSNLSNGKSIIVRINDRGPFHGNRIIDLSKAAATKLGFIRNGMANVRVETINTNKAPLTQLAENKEATPNHNLNQGSLIKTTAKTTAPLPDWISAPKAMPTTVKLPTPNSVNTKAMNEAEPIIRPVYLNVQQFSSISDANSFLIQAMEKMSVAKLNYPISVEKYGEAYAVRIGPFPKPEQAEELKIHLSSSAKPRAI